MIGCQFYAECDDCHGRVSMAKEIDSATAARAAAASFGFTTDAKGKHRCKDCSAKAGAAMRRAPVCQIPGCGCTGEAHAL